MSKLCKFSMCSYFKTAVTEFASHHTEAKPAGWSSGKRHCYRCGQRRIQGLGGCVGDASPPPAIFKHAFAEYNFFITSNFFDYDKPSALSTHNEKCTNKNIIYDETFRFRGKKFKQNLPQNCSRSTKMAITVCKFPKIFQGSMPPDPPRTFFYSQ